MTAKNAGDIFDLGGVQFSCNVTRIDNEGGKDKGLGYAYYKTTGIIEWPLPQPSITIPPGNTSAFACDISQKFTARLDGLVTPITLIQMRIRTTYSVNLGIFRWHRTAESQIFTWKPVPGGYQWLPGEIERDSR